MIRALISDFGGVLTSPLSLAFTAYSERTGISPEQIGAAMERVARAQGGRHPLFELEKGAISERHLLRTLGSVDPVVMLSVSRTLRLLLDT